MQSAEEIIKYEPPFQSVMEEEKELSVFDANIAAVAESYQRIRGELSGIHPAQNQNPIKPQL